MSNYCWITSLTKTNNLITKLLNLLSFSALNLEKDPVKDSYYSRKLTLPQRTKLGENGKNVGEKFLVKKDFRLKKIFSQKKFLVKKNFWPKKIFGPKIFLVQKFWSKKFYGSKDSFGQKCFLSTTFFGLKVFLVQRFFWSKNF